MLRFRNRFKTTPSPVKVCDCGQRVSFSVSDGRETIIHELPWCARFTELVETLNADPNVSLHVALVNPEGKETIIIADGELVADVRDAAP